MNKPDALKQFVALHQLLRKEKLQLETRLAEINQALGEAGLATQKARPAGPSLAPRFPARHRIKNPISLPKAVLQLTSRRPMTKQEILTEVGKLGYRFTAKDPLNSLNTVLYGKRPKFTNQGGKFSTGAVPAQASQGHAGSGIRKRTMSPAARAKIAAAARARWARIKQSKSG